STKPTRSAISIMSPTPAASWRSSMRSRTASPSAARIRRWCCGACSASEPVLQSDFDYPHRVHVGHVGVAHRAANLIEQGDAAEAGVPRGNRVYAVEQREAVGERPAVGLVLGAGIEIIAAHLVERVVERGAQLKRVTLTDVERLGQRHIVRE